MAGLGSLSSDAGGKVFGSVEFEVDPAGAESTAASRAQRTEDPADIYQRWL